MDVSRWLWEGVYRWTGAKGRGFFLLSEIIFTSLLSGNSELFVSGLSKDGDWKVIRGLGRLR